MICLDISTIYNKRFNRGLVINNGPLCRYYSFLNKLTVVKVFYPLDGHQKLVCLPVK
jgi:hypothetical protein